MSTLSPDAINAAARLLLQARRQQSPLSVLPAIGAPSSLADAYAIQDVIARELWPDDIRGWKAGAPGPDIEPITRAQDCWPITRHLATRKHARR